MASGGVAPSKLPGPPQSKIVEGNINTVRNLVEKKLNSSISLPTPTSNSIPELVNTVKRYPVSLNKDQAISAVNDILPRAHGSLHRILSNSNFQLPSRASEHCEKIPC